ncbi:MAG: ribosome biogenesis GTPase Der [Leptospirales bacterium]
MPSIGIVGAQNVGKSALFNALIFKRKSITFDEPGVTRDLVTESVDWGKGDWELTDFPGLETEKNLQDDELTKEAVQRVMSKLDEYSLLLWVVHRKGLSPYEHRLAELLRKMKKPVWLLVNFVDDPALEAEAAEFYELGFSDTYFISALNSRNISTLRKDIQEHFEPGSSLVVESDASDETSEDTLENDEVEEIDETKIRLAIIGKPNAGKSTFFNTLLQKDRALVFDRPGTTRDTIEDQFQLDGYNITLLDTAGLRKRTALKDSVEVFSVARTQQAIAECDAVIYLLNCTEGADRQNRNIIEWVQDESKPIVMALNKADLIDEEQKGHLEDNIQELQKQYWDFPYLFINAHEGKKTIRLVQKAISLYQKSCQKISTPAANKLLDDLKTNTIIVSHSVKLNYITYDAKRSKFILFTNRSKLPDNILRFLKKQIANKLNWKDIPFHLEVRKKS